MEELITNISTHFLTLTLDDPQEVKKEICCTLQAIGESIGVERCFIEIYSTNLSNIEYIYEWQADGINTAREKPQRCFV